WDIPNVKSKHVEKTNHPCQFPVALPRRLIRALSSPGAVILDPYLGSGTSAVAALLEKRSFIGCDVQTSYLSIAKRRLELLATGELPFRDDIPPLEPVR